MQNTAVPATTDDARIGRPGSAMKGKFMLDLGLQLILVKTGLAGLHSPSVSACRYCPRATHEFYFASTFQQSHLVDIVTQVDKLTRRDRAAGSLITNVSDPLHQVLVKFGIFTDIVVNPPAALE